MPEISQIITNPFNQMVDTFVPSKGVSLIQNGKILKCNKEDPENSKKFKNIKKSEFKQLFCMINQNAKKSKKPFCFSRKSFLPEIISGFQEPTEVNARLTVILSKNLKKGIKLVDSEGFGDLLSRVSSKSFISFYPKKRIGEKTVGLLHVDKFNQNLVLQGKKSPSFENTFFNVEEKSIKIDRRLTELKNN